MRLTPSGSCDPGNLAQGIISTTKEMVQTSPPAQHTLDGLKETAKIFEQGRKYYDALKAVHDVVKGGVKVKKSIGWWRTSRKSTCATTRRCWDPNYTPDGWNHLVRVRQAAERECGHPARPEETW